ncbi:MAG: FAD-dependent oxidoreductase [Coprococcus comes]|nr:FAD-dependent oxidoreductase [Coprococcus comes]
MKSKYKHIFEPFTIKHMTVKNRIVMTPMGTNYGEQNGEMSFLHINYYEQRAKGGTGLLIVENASVDSPQGSNGTTQLRIDQDNYIPRLFKLCETVHKHGSCIAIQINHAGASAQSARINMQPVSASDVPSKAGGEIPRPLEKDEIMHIVKKYGEAAKRAQIAGFDAVEIHAGHSYLISQFLSPLTNKRTDEFGGSLENRARLAKLVIEEVRRQVGPFFPIFVRISADEFMDGGNTLDDCLDYLQYFQEEVDVFDVSAGLNGSIQYQIDANNLPDGWRSYMAKAVKERYGKPCMTMGNIRNPQVAEDILASGDADLIGMGRGLIADPEWVNKVEFGDECDIRKCISCNIGCAGHRIGINRPIRCTVNPSVNGGEDYKKQKINKPCNVVVIGGGTAGLEAACTAAEVGCTTFLIEKKPELGGLAALISKIPDKKRLADFPNYLIHRASKLKNLFIFKNTEATIEMIRSMNPNIIVNATGSNPLLPPIKGLHENIDKEGGKVSSITNMINHVMEYPEDLKGKKVVVIGGGAVGLDVVEFFAPRGADVSIVEMMPVIGNGIDPVSKVGTFALMDKYGVKQCPNTALLEVKADSFLVKTPEGNEEEMLFDYGFVCLGMRANAPILDAVRKEFEDEDVEIMNIGDSVRARRIIEGTEEGRNILNVLAKHDYL